MTASGAMALAAFRPALVIFDKDGTLIDFHSMWSRWVRDFAERLTRAAGRDMAGPLYEAYGYDADAARARPNGPLAVMPMADLRDLAGRVLARHGCPPGQVEPALRAAWHIPDPVATARPLTDLAGLFRALRARGARIAVATTDDRAPTRATLHALGAWGEVDALVCGDEGVPVKPSPQMIWHVCAALGAAPAQAMMIGDTVADMQMGRAAGVGLTVGVLSGVSPVEVLAPYADAVIPSVAALV